MSRTPAIGLLLLAGFSLAGSDPRECWLGIANGDCGVQGTAQALFPQDDAVCRSYGLTPDTKAYATCRHTKARERALTARETDYGFLQSPLTPNFPR